MGNTCNGAYCCSTEENKTTIDKTGNYNIQVSHEDVVDQSIKKNIILSADDPFANASLEILN